uniref:Uncharacterized protein n=1 Tax=Panagrellus redivivus TaxID=6233 RepID=A0A7E4VXJ6_PANRE
MFDHVGDFKESITELPLRTFVPYSNVFCFVSFGSSFVQGVVNVNAETTNEQHPSPLHRSIPIVKHQTMFFPSVFISSFIGPRILARTAKLIPMQTSLSNIFSKESTTSNANQLQNRLVETQAYVDVHQIHEF